MEGRVADEEAAKKIYHHFVKSAGFRVIHVDGAHGGITPQGYVQMTLYSERQPIPKRTTHEVFPSGEARELEGDRVARDGLVRECEVTALMDVPTAVALRDWLNNRIELVQRMLEERSGE